MADNQHGLGNRPYHKSASYPRLALVGETECCDSFAKVVANPELCKTAFGHVRLNWCKSVSHCQTLELYSLAARHRKAVEAGGRAQTPTSLMRIFQRVPHDVRLTRKPWESRHLGNQPAVSALARSTVPTRSVACQRSAARPSLLGDSLKTFSSKISKGTQSTADFGFASRLFRPPSVLPNPSPTLAARSLDALLKPRGRLSAHPMMRVEIGLECIDRLD
jgi:hypothetical protein